MELLRSESGFIERMTEKYPSVLVMMAVGKVAVFQISNSESTILVKGCSLSRNHLGLCQFLKSIS